MKGTEKIIAHIRSDAQAQADAIIAQAEQMCASIRDDYETKAKNSYNSRLREGVKACEDRVDSLKRIDDMERRKSMLSLKQSKVAESFALALRKLGAMPESDYVAFLAKLAARASVTGEEELVLNQKDRAAVGEKAVVAANAALRAEGRTAKLTLSADTADIAGGLLLRRGNIEANCSIELLVELCRDEMAAALSDVLFA